MPRKNPQMWRHELKQGLKVKRKLLDEYLQAIFKDETLAIIEDVRSKPEKRRGRFPSDEIAKEFLKPPPRWPEWKRIEKLKEMFKQLSEPCWKVLVLSKRLLRKQMVHEPVTGTQVKHLASIPLLQFSKTPEGTASLHGHFFTYHLFHKDVNVANALKDALKDLDAGH